VAGPGFDGPSGVGSLRGLGALRPLAPTVHVVHKHRLKATVPARFRARAHDPFPGGSVTAFHWRWGDGTGSRGAARRHRYARPGRYRVRLVVRDNYGVSRAVAFTVRVRR
jgi:hypothetical protein